MANLRRIDHNTFNPSTKTLTLQRPSFLSTLHPFLFFTSSCPFLSFSILPEFNPSPPPFLHLSSHPYPALQSFAHPTLSHTSIQDLFSRSCLHLSIHSINRQSSLLSLYKQSSVASSLHLSFFPPSHSIFNTVVTYRGIPYFRELIPCTGSSLP